MTTRKSRHLKNAPITEALIDFLLPTGRPANIASLRALAQKLSTEFPKNEEIRALQIRVGGPGQTTNVASDNLLGFKLTSADGKSVVQLKTIGFTYSRLQPYGKWDDLLSAFRKNWDLYQAATGTKEIGRIGVRFINNLNLPLPIKFLGDYLTAPPTVPSNLPQTLREFITRVVVDVDEMGASAIITQALGRGTYDKYLPVVLDIDVYLQRQLAVTDKDVWSLLPLFRDKKNDIFFSSITRKAEELYS